MKWTVIQCITACVTGVAIYAAMSPHENPKAPLVAALIVGFGSAWVLTKICERLGIKSKD